MSLAGGVAGGFRWILLHVPGTAPLEERATQLYAIQQRTQRDWVTKEMGKQLKTVFNITMDPTRVIVLERANFGGGYYGLDIDWPVYPHQGMIFCLTRAVSSQLRLCLVAECNACKHLVGTLAFGSAAELGQTLAYYTHRRTRCLFCKEPAGYNVHPSLDDLKDKILHY